LGAGEYTTSFKQKATGNGKGSKTPLKRKKDKRFSEPIDKTKTSERSQLNGHRKKVDGGNAQTVGESTAE